MVTSGHWLVCLIQLLILGTPPVLYLFDWILTYSIGLFIRPEVVDSFRPEIFTNHPVRINLGRICNNLLSIFPLLSWPPLLLTSQQIWTVIFTSQVWPLMIYIYILNCYLDLFIFIAYLITDTGPRTTRDNPIPTPPAHGSSDSLPFRRQAPYSSEVGHRNPLLGEWLLNFLTFRIFFLLAFIALHSYSFFFIYMINLHFILQLSTSRGSNIDPQLCDTKKHANSSPQYEHHVQPSNQPSKPSFLSSFIPSHYRSLTL